MLVRWGDFDRSFSHMEDLRRRMDRLMNDWNGVARGASDATSPRLNLWDQGSTLVLEAELPGLTEKDITLNLNRDVVTLSGERRVEAPEGHSVHRRERASQKFSRSVVLPVRVDPEKVEATLKDGVLRITMTKAAEAQLRQITVKSQ